MPGTRKKLTKKVEASAKRWLEAAVDVLTKEGVEKVKVEQLAVKLGGTKGSFYYAYRDRRELLDAILAHFEEENRIRCLEQPPELHGKAMDKLMNLWDSSVDQNFRDYDWAVRKWADTDPKAAEVVARIDRLRQRIITDLFIELGFEDAEASARASVAYIAALGTRAVSKELPPQANRLYWRRKLLAILTDGK